MFRWLYSEIALSSIIRELLDPKGVHGQGDVFLRRFLDLDIVGLGHLVIDPNAPRPTCEEPTTYATSPLRRIDIFLRPDDRFAIGIENKPRAVDQPGWVKDYSDHLTNKYGDGYLPIYLTADPGEPSGADERTAKGLGRKFLNISYKKDTKIWLESRRDACRADNVRGFLKDFINYVKVMEETEMLSEQDRTLIADYICDPPVTPIRDDKLLDKWNEFKASKGQWGGRFALAWSFEWDDCVGLTFGIYKSSESAPHIPGLKSRMDEATGIKGRDWPHWEWVLPVDKQYKNWNVPDTLEKLASKNDALDYFVGWFLKTRELAEPLIDSACLAA